MPWRVLSLQVSRPAAQWCFVLHEGAASEGFVLDEEPEAAALARLVARQQAALDVAALRPMPSREPVPAELVPGALVQRLRGYAAQEPVLLLVDAKAPFDRLAWELAPAAWRIPLLHVVRRVPAPVRAGSARPPRRAVVIACGPLDGDARRELDAVTALLTRRLESCVRIEDPTLDQAAQACQGDEALLVHLITNGRRGHDGAFAFFFPDERGAPTLHDSDAVARALAGAPPPQGPTPAQAPGPAPAPVRADKQGSPTLVLLNACGTGLGAAPALVRRAPDALVLGWFGDVLSATAADFALGFYARLFGGQHPLAALAAAAPPCAALLACVSAPEVLDRLVADPGDASRGEKVRGRDRGPSFGGHGEDAERGPSRDARPVAGVERARRDGSRGDRIELEFMLVPAICPALLVNGCSPVRRLSVTSPTRRTGLRLHLSCDTGNGVSTWREILDLEPEIPVTRTESSFPALHELIARRVGRRQVSFTAAVTDDDRVLVELTRSTSYLGPTEWLDEPSAWRYLPSYVLPDSGGAKRVVTAALTLLQGSGDDLDGKGAGEEVDRKVAALYEAMRSLNLAYIAPPGAPVYVDAAEALPLARAVGQRVRFPNEVAEHQRGTCHDLALLLAASAEHVGIWPWLVLIPGHTFVGYWRDPAAQRDFWDAPRGEAARSYGDPWVITQRRELSWLVSAGAVGVVETIAATRFGGALSFDGACARARGYFTDNPRPLSCAVDVWAARAQVEPLYRAWTEE